MILYILISVGKQSVQLSASQSLVVKWIKTVRDLQFPTTFTLKSQNLKLNENRFQELVQNCGMRYQLSTEHYQNPFLKGKFV